MEQQQEKEKYVFCMFIGHGYFVTRMNNQQLELVPISTSPLTLRICTFAPPGEGCHYPPDKLIELKDSLIQYSKKLPKDDNFDKYIEQVISMAQSESAVTVTYRDPEWAGYFHKRPYFSEQCKKTNEYFEKIFSSDPEIKTGIYIIKNNIGLPNGSIFSFDDFNNLTTIIQLFTGLDVNGLYVLDATCSVFLNSTKTGYLDISKDKDARTIRRISQDLLKLGQIAGRKKRKSRNRNRRKTRKNKGQERKMCT